MSIPSERGDLSRPPQTVQRYLVEKTTSRHIIWRFNNKVRAMPPGRTLRVETLAPALVHWSVDGWRTVHEIPTRDTTLGVHVADIETLCLRIGERVDFTFYWPEADRWEESFLSSASNDQVQALPMVSREMRFRLPGFRNVTD